MVCRNKERGEAALSEILSTTGSTNVHLEVFCFIGSHVLFLSNFLSFVIII